MFRLIRTPIKKMSNVFDKSLEPAVTVSVMVTVSLSVSVTASVHDMSCQMLKLILGTC